jgi:hypothetical protein
MRAGISVLLSHARAIGRLYRIKFRKLLAGHKASSTCHDALCPPASPAAESFKKFLLNSPTSSLKD